MWPPPAATHSPTHAAALVVFTFSEFGASRYCLLLLLILSVLLTRVTLGNRLRLPPSMITRVGVHKQPLVHRIRAREVDRRTMSWLVVMNLAITVTAQHDQS